MKRHVVSTHQKLTALMLRGHAAIWGSAPDMKVRILSLHDSTTQNQPTMLVSFYNVL